jgi:hypothetical protein
MGRVHFAKPDSISNSFRMKRFRLIQGIITETLKTPGICRILDVGGTPQYWTTFGRDLDWSRLQVTLVNITAPETGRPEIVSLVGDARCMRQFDDLSFDLVHSNSVIEHVGRWDDMNAAAKEIRRLAPRYFVQTPYFWFPMEPHFRLPFFHWMPEQWRCRIVMSRACGYIEKQPDVGRAVKAIESAVLLDRMQMQFLFPDARIVPERVFGMTKSLMAIR